MSAITYTDKTADSDPTTGYFTNLDANAVKTAVNDNDSRLDTIEGISGIVKVSGGTPAAAVAGTDYIGLTVNILNPADDTWQGKTAAAVAGESLTSANQWAPLYCKDTGSGTRFYLYDADATDADTYSPIALLVSSGTYSAGDAITVTVGDGVLANDTWAAAQAQVGTAIYCSTTAGSVSYTAPSSTGDHVKQIGTLVNLTANGRDVWDVSFRYPDWKL